MKEKIRMNKKYLIIILIFGVGLILSVCLNSTNDQGEIINIPFYTTLLDNSLAILHSDNSSTVLKLNQLQVQQLEDGGFINEVSGVRYMYDVVVSFKVKASFLEEGQNGYNKTMKTYRVKELILR